MPGGGDGARLRAKKYHLFAGSRDFSWKSMKIGAFSWCTQPDASSHVSSLCKRSTVWEPPGLWHGGLNPAAMPRFPDRLCREEKRACEPGRLSTACPGQEAPRPPGCVLPAVDKEGPGGKATAGLMLVLLWDEGKWKPTEPALSVCPAAAI